MIGFVTRRHVVAGAVASVAAAAMPPTAAIGPAEVVLDHGRYFVAGTRVPALALLSYLVCGREAQIAADYPDLPADAVDAVWRWHAAEQDRLNEIARSPGSAHYGLWPEQPDNPFGGMARSVLSIWRKTGGSDAEFGEMFPQFALLVGHVFR